jgi:hypothetical protein
LEKEDSLRKEKGINMVEGGVMMKLTERLGIGKGGRISCLYPMRGRVGGGRG